LSQRFCFLVRSDYLAPDQHAWPHQIFLFFRACTMIDKDMIIETHNIGTLEVDSGKGA
jgi:hypothetical protein